MIADQSGELLGEAVAGPKSRQLEASIDEHLTQDFVWVAV
jgi:hypothetical protein